MGKEGEPREGKQTEYCGAAREVRTGRRGTEGGLRLSSLLKIKCNHAIKDDMKMRTCKGSKCNPKIAQSLGSASQTTSSGTKAGKMILSTQLLLVDFPSRLANNPRRSFPKRESNQGRRRSFSPCVMVRCRGGSCSQPAHLMRPDPGKHRLHLTLKPPFDVELQKQPPGKR